MSKPWYHDGLRFTCTRCGHCCSGQPGYVWVDEEETAQLAALCNEPLDKFVAQFVRKVGTRYSLRNKLNGDCVFYDSERGCTVYDARPRQCRSWPFWESNLVAPEAWQRTCQECPGSGQGELIAPEEIVRRAKLIRL